MELAPYSDDQPYSCFFTLAASSSFSYHLLIRSPSVSAIWRDVYQQSDSFVSNLNQLFLSELDSIMKLPLLDLASLV